MNERLSRSWMRVPRSSFTPSYRRAFFIPTPVGNYNPDWAISFQAGQVKHVYFIAETKGSMSSMDLRAIEASKIACARKFFAKITSDQVKYDVVDSYGKLMALVK
jgi:type III restriction enzyme